MPIEPPFFKCYNATLLFYINIGSYSEHFDLSNN